MKKLKKHFVLSAVSLLIIGTGVVGLNLTLSSPTAAANLKRATECGSGIKLVPDSNCTVEKQEEACKGRASSPEAKANCNSQTGLEKLIKTIINVFSAVVGAISVIMIIIGGFRYVTSGGDQNSVSGAKNTILYAIVGLIIVAFAQIIVQFILQRI